MPGQIVVPKTYADLSGMAALELLYRWCATELLPLREQENTDGERVSLTRVQMEIRRMQKLMRSDSGGGK